MNLSQFLSSKWPNNAWIKEKNIEVYVRKSVRVLGQNVYPCLEIGNVNVNENHKGKGVFTAFLKRFEKEAEKLHRYVYVENLLEPRLINFLLKNGYKLVPGANTLAPCVYKLFTT